MVYLHIIHKDKLLGDDNFGSKVNHQSTSFVDHCQYKCLFTKGYNDVGDVIQETLRIVLSAFKGDVSDLHRRHVNLLAISSSAVRWMVTCSRSHFNRI